MLKVFNSDAVTALRCMDSESVQCCVTSIPYWSMRDYGIDPIVWDDFVGCEHEWDSAIRIGGGGQPGEKVRWQHAGNGTNGHQKTVSQFCRHCGAWLGSWGLEPNVDLYVQHTVQVFRELRRVLKKTGTLWLNIGDCYIGGGRGADVGGSLKGSHIGQLQSRRAQAALRSTRNNRSESHKAGRQSFRRDRVDVGDVQHKQSPGLKTKDLIGMPWMVAFALRADGWYLRSDIVWHKPNAMPESVTDRPTRAHEYIFLLTRSPRYYYDAAAIADDVSGNTHPRKSSKIGSVQSVTPKSAPANSGIRANLSWHEATSKEVVLVRNKRSVWTVPTAPFADAHFATFPPNLVRPCILAGTRTGDTVLDICGGSGTTGMVAIEHGRQAVIIEPKPEYCQMIEKRTKVTIGLPL